MLYPGHCVAEGTDGFKWADQETEEFTWAVKTLAPVEDVTELMGQPDPKEGNILLTLRGMVYLQSDS